jgi:beta-glucanase (GH16 family)
MDGRERPGWELVWADEFEGSGLPDPSRWTYETGFVRNAEKQYYTKARPENARVEGGVLVLEARREPWEEGAEYTSASVTTSQSAAWTYGRIEVRAKIPTGRGTWPAIWMLGDSIAWNGWPRCGEIDIMEHVGFDPGKIHATVHTAAYNHVKGTQKGAAFEAGNPAADFHVYAAEWTPDEIVFFYDDREIFRFRNEGTGPGTWPFDAPHYLILNVAIGGGWGGQKGIDDSIFPVRMLVDYVRVYQRPAGEWRKADRPPAPPLRRGPSVKKGVGHWGRGMPEAMRELGCAWYYNWGPRPTEAEAVEAEFVPMVWSEAFATDEHLAFVKQRGYRTLLGFNEPDSKDQGNVSVEDALRLWPKLEATGARLGSPATTMGAAWHDRFMEGARQRGLRVDVQALHWYGDITRPGAVSELHQFLRRYWERYRLPIWLTEWSGADFESHHRKTTPADNAAFARESCALLEALPYVERYAWFASWPMKEDAAYSTAGLYERHGKLSPVGVAYRDAGPREGGGLAYRIYEGAWRSLPDFAALRPVEEGITPVLGTAGRGGENFAIVLEGFVDVPAAGTWTFSTVSDDGSRLLIGGRVVVDNDGLHALRARAGRIGLAAGRHAIRIEYFQAGGEGRLAALWEGPGVPREEIPSAALTPP